MFFERGIQISRRRLFLFFADLLLILASSICASFIRLGFIDGWAYVLEHIPTLSGSALILLIIFYAGGMYEREALARKESSYKLPLITVVISMVIIIIIFYARFNLHLGRGILLIAGGLIFLSAWIIRRMYRVAVGYGLLSKNALIVGEGKSAVDVIKLLSKNDDAGYKIFGIVSCARARPGEFLQGVPILGHLDKLKEFSDVYAIETIIVATSLAREHSLLRVLRPLRYQGVEIMDYASLYEEQAQEIPLDHIDDEWLMNAAMNSSRIHIRKMKRILDVVVSVLGLLLTSLISLLAMILIKLDSKGPVLYRQRRSGLDGRPFTVLKFRTMRQDAESGTGAVWAGKADLRVTRMGRFLRKWRIDEIPQLVCVLKGEMSLTGPRPERPEFVDTLAEAIPFYKERLLVPPGITGWAQVKYPYAASVEAARRKLQYDLYYIKHMSFYLDTLILLRTFKTILIGIRHHDDHEGTIGPDEVETARNAEEPVLTIMDNQRKEDSA